MVQCLLDVEVDVAGDVAGVLWLPLRRQHLLPRIFHTRIQHHLIQGIFRLIHGAIQALGCHVLRLVLQLAVPSLRSRLAQLAHDALALFGHVG